MEPLHEIHFTGNDSAEISEELTMHTYFKGVEFTEMLWERLEEIAEWELLYSEFVYSIVVENEGRRLKALLREMRVRVLKPIGSIKRLRRLLFSHISLLFGLCSSQSSLILNAFYGNSLSRIPSF
jgi:hypothetical protein